MNNVNDEHITARCNDLLTLEGAIYCSVGEGMQMR